MLDGKRVLLIISGGIAAYKCLELIRRLRERGCAVRCVMTKAAENFVTPLSEARGRDLCETQAGRALMGRRRYAEDRLARVAIPPSGARKCPR